jgi:hypothetical protein
MIRSLTVAGLAGVVVASVLGVAKPAEAAMCRDGYGRPFYCRVERHYELPYASPYAESWREREARHEYWRRRHEEEWRARHYGDWDR